MADVLAANLIFSAGITPNVLLILIMCFILVIFELGVGGFLHIYELPENNLIKRTKIFEGQKIFGIKPNSQDSKLIVYGGKNIVVLPFQDMELGVTVNQHILADWILNVKWIENDKKIVTVFMHNKITVWSENFSPEISVMCEERCILYSADICYNNYNQLLILSGTVFSEILLWKPFYTGENGLSSVLNRLKQHNGVIFSIHCNLESGLICTASDDRSAILWKIVNTELLSNITPANSHMLQINSSCQVYGHLSRVFRCLVLKDFFITAGEDSLLIIWNFEGSILRKIDSHQGPIWSLCYESDKDIICSGGNNGAISVFRANPQITKKTISLPIPECPKIVGLLKTGNMICFSEKAILYHRINNGSLKWQEVAKHNDMEKYSILQISPCKRMVALAGFQGQIYIYQETNGILKLQHSYCLKNKTRIFSFHWISCSTFLVSQKNGFLSVFFMYEQKIHYVQTFQLPPIKERWPTCACALNDHIIIGDRHGNIYNFKIGNRNVINSKKKTHNYLGVTNLYSENDVIISLGKDGFLKRFKLLNGYLECIEAHKTKFSWLAARENNCVLAFSGDNLVVFDFKSQRVLFQTHCGGGHRSWDYLKTAGNITCIFIKQKVINEIKFDLNNFTPKDVIQGYHVREINSLKVLNIGGQHLILSGGEDTILRISLLQKNNTIGVIKNVKVHLSSIRAIHLHPLPNTVGNTNNSEEYLLFTAGGRAQIICWHLHVQIKHLTSPKISCTEKCNFYQPLNQDEAETRIMDLSVVRFNGQLFLFVGCSDGFIKIFLITNDMSLQFQKSILHSHHSITKLSEIHTSSLELLGSMATDGNLIFWSVPNICDSKKPHALCLFKIHQSGITSYSYIVKDQEILFLSGGDDNCVILTLFTIGRNKNSFTISKVATFQDEGIHCAQITGAYLFDKYFMTSSIDQRIVISKWTCTEGQVEFKSLEKYDTTIADPQGLEVILGDNNLNLYVYGNGVEHLQVKIGTSFQL